MNANPQLYTSESLQQAYDDLLLNQASNQSIVDTKEESLLMEYEIGKIYTFSNKEGAYLYKGGDPSDQNSWKSNVMS